MVLSAAVGLSVNYSRHLFTGQVQYSNGEYVSDSRMVRKLNGDLNSGLIYPPCFLTAFYSDVTSQLFCREKPRPILLQQQHSLAQLSASKNAQVRVHSQELTPNKQQQQHSLAQLSASKKSMDH